MGECAVLHSRVQDARTHARQCVNTQIVVMFVEHLSWEAVQYMLYGQTKGRCMHIVCVCTYIIQRHGLRGNIHTWYFGTSVYRNLEVN